MVNKHYPEDLKRDIVSLARAGETSDKQIAADVGMAETTLYRWIKRFDVDEGRRPGATSDELAERAPLRKDRRRLEQENEILRRAKAYFARDVAPNWMCTRWSENSPSTGCPVR